MGSFLMSNHHPKWLIIGIDFRRQVFDTLRHLVVNSYNKPNYFSFSLNHKNLQLSFVILVPIIHIFHLYWSVIDDLFAFHYITRNGTKDIIWLFKKLRFALVSIDPWPHFCQILLIDHTTFVHYHWSIEKRYNWRQV